jgi:hypothetical protein
LASKTKIVATTVTETKIFGKIGKPEFFEGLKDGLLIKSIHIPIENNFKPHMFRQTNDVYSMVKKIL